MAAFSRGWAFSSSFSITPFRLPICRRCLVHTTNQQRRPFASSLVKQLAKKRSSNTPSKALSKNDRVPQEPNPPKTTSSSQPPKSFPSTPTKTDASNSPTKTSSAPNVALQENVAFLTHLNQNPILITPQVMGHRVPKDGQILYQAPSHKIYIFAALSLSAILFIYTASSASMRSLGGPSTEKPWLPLFTNGILVVMSGGAAWWMLYGAMGLCKRIIAIPIPKGTMPRGGMRVRVEGSGLNPWKTISVEADIADLSLARSMEEVVRTATFKASTRLPESQVSAFVRPFERFGRGIRSFGKEALNVALRQHMPALLIETPGKKGTRKLKLDVRGQAFGGAKGFDRLIYPRT